MGFGLDPLYTPKRHVTGTEIAVFDTSKGTIRVRLDGAGAPIHVANFCELAESGFYDDTKFHRYVPGYRIKAEFASNPHNLHDDGALAMARSSDPDSAGSQFYFCLGSQHGLDSGYTVFGKTLEGKAVIAELRAGDVLHSVRIETA